MKEGIMIGMSRHWNRMRLGFVISLVMAVVFCHVVMTHGQQKWTPAQKGSYGRMTRDALDRLLASAEKLRAGDPKGAKQVLQGMEGPLAELTAAADFFRERANQEYARCVENIGALDTRIAEIYQQELEVKVKIGDLDAQLENILTKKTLTETEITRLRNSVQITEQKIQERDRKLEELRKWWWVPGYGLYLSIRTLVDDDIGNYNSLKNTLDDASIRMSRHQQELQAANTVREALRRESEFMRKTHLGLQEMRSRAEAELGNLKKSAVFLTDAGIFWKRVIRLLRIDVSQSVELAKEIMNLESLMTRENSAPQFDDLQKRPIVELYESLVSFADTIDQGNNFLMAEGTDFSGGPPRPASGPNVSSGCNIEQFTAYYEIVDPKTCTFRYLSPPGCPPRPRPIVRTEQAVAAGKARGTWERASDQNWIGRSRCDVANSIYYGKESNQEDCERKCMSDGACVTWTFNQRNAYMGGDTRGECWGGTRALSPLKQSWGGFQSGGIK
jgi:hypothetical protein